jgi:hypothetical protein
MNESNVKYFVDAYIHGYDRFVVFKEEDKKKVRFLISKKYPKTKYKRTKKVDPYTYISIEDHRFILIE